MKNIIYLISVLLIACSSNAKKTESVLFDLKNTSWFYYPSYYVNDYPHNLNYTSIVLFKDKKALFYPYSNSFKGFQLNADTLEWNKNLFKISEITSDTLVLVSLSKETNQLPFLELSGDNPTDYRVKLINLESKVDSSIQFETITFSSGSCFGKCPEMDIEILKSGEIYYKGRKNVPLLGNYKGSLSDSLLKQMVFAIQTSSIQEIDSKRGSEDDQIFYLTLATSNNKIYNVTGTVLEQNGLHLLLYELLTIHQKTILEKSDLEYQFSTAKKLDRK